jgi:ubiquinone/menaquinone biosynthesis C-methylase UbiE
VNSASRLESHSSIGPSDGSGPNSSCLISVAEGYERWAPTYDSAPNPLLAREERHLWPLLENLQTERILDLACGTGRWLEKLTTKNGRPGVGVDASEAMLRVARQKTELVGKTARATCENLPFASGVFDLGICSFALGHIRELAAMTRELGRVTIPGASVFVTDLHPDAYQQGWRVGFRDSSGPAQIELAPRSAGEIVESFYWNGFECLAQTSLWLGEPEKPIFAQAGKAESFENACLVPAILALQFRRFDSGKNFRRSQ